ncbi:MAG: lactate utilization protein C [Planctomycetaceae bacterium]
MPSCYTMTSRDEILSKVRQRLPVATELPRLDLEWTRYNDAVGHFGTVLAGVGGICQRVADLTAAQAVLEGLPTYVDARQRYSAIPGLGQTTLDRAAITDPHQLEDVDFAVLPGEVAVAENGAIWVATDDLLQRTLYFITQHLSIVVPTDNLVSNMHEAYARLDVTRCRFGTFVSGPSKTADIEQSLVIGAHGARSLTVLLVDQRS